VAALAVRAAHSVLQPAEYTTFFQASLGNGLTYLMSFLFPLGAGFGFVLANLERLAANLNELATVDALTGCTNRGVFEAVLQHAVERGHREAAPVSLIVIDVDHFKQVNDLHGHPAGDAVLRGLAATLRTRLRASDPFGRLGGEEFGVVLAGTDAAAASHVAEDLRATVEATAVGVGDGKHLGITISLGVSTADSRSRQTRESLFAQADRALYEAKRAGRNRVAIAPSG
jgi:diguanylate cyclase (GGDEF)-like protein